MAFIDFKVPKGEASEGRGLRVKEIYSSILYCHTVIRDSE